MRNSNGPSAELEENTGVLLAKIGSYLTEEGDYPLSVPNVTLHRRHNTHTPENCFYKPIVGLTLQGAKRTVIGNREYRYGAGNCIVTGVDMPSINYITDASAERPYLVVSLYLDLHLVSQLAPQVPARAGNADGNSVVAPTDPEVLGAFLRLVELEEKPEQIPVLAPLIVREIHFRLLTGPQGNLLRAIGTHGTQSNRIAQAINWIRNNFKNDLEVEILAGQVHMSPPTFRKHFKLVTSMSPTEYHKRLRLYEAQRLMLEENSDAINACYAVGYESAGQFNREYKRLFGDPPQRNVSRLR